MNILDQIRIMENETRTILYNNMMESVKEYNKIREESSQTNNTSLEQASSLEHNKFNAIKYIKKENRVEISIDNYNVIIYNDNPQFITIIDEQNKIYVFMENTIHFYDNDQLIACSDINHLIPLLTYCKYSLYPPYKIAVEKPMQNMNFPSSISKTLNMNFPSNVSTAPQSYLTSKYFNNKPFTFPEAPPSNLKPFPEAQPSNLNLEPVKDKPKTKVYRKKIPTKIIEPIIQNNVQNKRKYVSCKKVKTNVVQPGKHRLLEMHGL